ncbi:MAG: 4Fe-4S dicluster domain-containing protein [Candidatus Omnitrophica bacterium]|nr:4Fe-4S dicluster domain-containing protein [Candidatus Omnitrophota bacterium]
MRYPKLRELKEAIRALLKGPYTTKFPFHPHKPFERFRGKPYYYEKDCIGCTACVNVCPSRALEFKDRIENGRGKRVLTYTVDVCIFCGQCQANCPTEKGIMLSQDFDLATTGKRELLKQEIEKDLLLCECCGDVVAPRDQIAWVAKKIGPLCFSNASLLLFYLENMGLAAKGNPVLKQDTEYLRADRLKILCPSCRRQAAIKS